PLMNLLQDVGAPLPPALETAREYVLHEDIRHKIEADPIDFEQLSALIKEAQTRNGHVLDANLSFVVKNRMEQMIQHLAAHPQDLETISALIRLAQLVMPLPIGLNLWKVQNTYWGLVPLFRRQTPVETDEGPEADQARMSAFLELGQTLGFAPNALRAPEPAAIAA